MPVVTITRSLGSDGDAVARATAELTGYRLIDRDAMVAEVEARVGAQVQRTAPEMAEKQPSFWERLNEERRRYNAILRAGVYSLAQEDNVVIVGLGAGFLLKDLSSVLRVLVVAPLETRVRRVLEQRVSEGVSPMSWDDAEQMVRHSDKERAGHIRYLFNQDGTAPHNYDLVINTERVTPEEAARLIVHALREFNIAATLGSRKRLADLALASRVEALLVSNAGIWVQRLRVSADNGRVTISGEVISDEDRAIAEQIALSVPGVVEVVDDLLIQPPPLTGL